MIVDILGLGESLSLHDGNNITFGVNDIFRVKPVDYLVCVDRMKAFTDERLNVIKNSTPKRFYSQLDEWSFMPNFQRIELQRKYPDRVANLNTNELPKSCFSPYVAIGLAYRLFHPSLIRLFGVDMVTHPHLHNQTNRIMKDWRAMLVALKRHGCDVKVFGNGLLTYNSSLIMV